MSDNAESESEKPLTRLKSLIQRLSSIDMESVINDANLGPFNFKRFEPTFNQIVDFANELDSLPLEHLREERILANRA